MKNVCANAVLLLMALCLSVGTTFSQEENQTTDFTEITGKVVDSSNKPIKKFKARVIVYDYSEGGWQKTPKTLASWNGEFEDGKFEFKVEESIAVNDMTYVSQTITAEGYLVTNRNNGFIQLKGFNGKFRATKLSRGVKIKGKVVLPDGHADEEVAQPTVYLSKAMSQLAPDWNNMFQTRCTVKEDGTFETTVPENCKLIVTCSADNAATSTHEFKIPKSGAKDQEEDFGELKLKPGVAVSGVVLDQDGNPVEGQIVQFMQDVKNRSMISSFVYGCARTDEEGKFTLPPREGKGEVSLVESGRIGGEQVKVKGELLKAKPMNLTIKEGQPAAELEIREANSYKVSGVIQYEGPKPTVYFSWGRSSQPQVEIDADGNFEVEIVEGVTPWLMIQKWDGENQMMARMSSASRREFAKHFSSNISGETYYFQFKKISSDIGPLEFKMVRQFIDNRSWMDRFIDWYYYGDD